MSYVPAWLPDAIKVLGGLLLIYPALRVSHFAKTYFHFDQIDLNRFPSEQLKSHILERKEEAFRKQLEWNVLDQVVLFSGLALVVIGDVLLVAEKIFLPVH